MNTENLSVPVTTKIKKRKNSTNSNESSDLSDDVFYTYSSNIQIESNFVDEVEVSKNQQKRLSLKRTKIARCRRKHDNLDTKSLTFIQKFRLAKAQYVNFPNFIRLLIIVGSLNIFAYNIKNILTQYFEYKTQILIDFQKPNWTTLPQITFCTHCVLCAYDKKWFKNRAIEELLRDEHMWWFTTNHSSVAQHLKLLNDATIECWVRHSDNQRNNITCDKIAPVIESFMFGHKSDFYGNMRRKKKTHPELTNIYFENYPEIIFSVKGYFLSLAQTNESPKNDSTESILGGDGKGFWTSFSNHGKYFTGIYFAIHNPDSHPEQTYIAFRRLTMGQDSFITFSRRVQRLLPKPFDPYCFPYRSDAVSPDAHDIKTITAKKERLTSSGLSPYRSRTECYLHCMHRLLNTDRCGNFYSSYTSQILSRESLYRMQEDVQLNSFKYANFTYEMMYKNYVQKFNMVFCENSSKDEFMKAKEICLDTCPPNCFVESFTEDEFGNTETIKTSDVSRLTIRWASKYVVSLQHKPKVISNQSELLSLIGGNVFFFLEVSLAFLISYFVHFIEYLNILPRTSCIDIYLKWKQRFVKPKNVIVIVN